MSLESALARLAFTEHPFEPGHVWLAGAGPGDPGCLTVDVLSALAQADAVVYDALVPSRIVAVAKDAELHFAGKRGGRPSMQQEAITDLLIALAGKGRKVLRLKGGDPYMFGRGGEEALALARANIPFRILPGVTSAIAGMAAAGIPATMRGINKAVIFATGHAVDTDDDLDWPALAQTGQPIVVYMGMTNIGRIAEKIIDAGLAAETPAAVLMAATTPEERVLVATLATIADEAAAQGFGSPALIVIGGIVSMRSALISGAAE